jgi:shikimate kinase
MSAPRAIYNLTLIGFMGTGKSSIGRHLSTHLHFRFVDTDEMIESRAGRSIAEIFAQAGEEVFRGIERQIVLELAKARKSVISTGGGIAANAENLASLKSHSLVVCLWASPEVIWERVHNQTHRPLLQGPDPMARIRELLAKRESFYKQADVLVNTEMRSIKEVSQQVLHQFNLARSSATVR